MASELVTNNFPEVQNLREVGVHVSHLMRDYFGQLVSRAEDVGKLNAAILQLAVQGKLVAQDPNDEPASELLKQIAAEKKRLGIKSKPLLEIGAEERPFALPHGWEWAQLDDVSEIIMGQSPPGNSYNDVGEGIPLINGPVEFGGNGPFDKTKKTKFTTAPTKFCQEDDLLLCVRGSTTGRTNVAGFDACIGRGVAAIRAKIDQDYLNYFILSHRNAIYNRGTGSTFPSVSQDKIRGIVLSLPPLAEQKRIVERVDTLLVQTRQLETELAEAEQSLGSLHNAATQELLAATDVDDFAAKWQFIADNFDTLYDEAYPEAALANVAALKQAILQLAVQGKLTRQDPADEPASALLARIAAEKKRLGIKSKELAEIGEEERPFALPDGWEWVRMNDITILVTDGEHATPPRIDYEEIPLVTAKNVRDGYLDLGKTDFVTLKTAKKSWHRCHPLNDDLLMVCVGATTGRASLAKNPPPMVLVRSVALMRPYPQTIYPEYLEMVVKSPLGQSQVWNLVKRTAQPVLYLNKIKQIVMPLPPLAEQRRIVTRVNTLLRLCDDLSAHTQEAQATRTALRDAVLAGM